ncbi:lipid II flippase MurJ [Janthinobacterium sp. LM6]|uniref:lipid II flippase MurJ n=1 Tax=Janthinobacterium sp. LM6 TaxID=1938606 RepID=UPI001237435E|nr:lipid II flippase MurJ [Janthinobacterium sp. LM6]
MLAVLGAGIGLMNSVLVWKLFGTDINSDIWLLNVGIIAILSLLVLIGVEQFQVFYTEIYLRNKEDAADFLGGAFVWAIVSGLVFSAVCFVIVNAIMDGFAGGFGRQAKELAIPVFLILLIQVAFSPLLHVVRCTLNVHHYYGASYCLSLILPLGQLLSLLVFILLDEHDVIELAKWSSFSILVQLVLYPLILIKWASFPKNIDTKFFISFIKNSFTMRIGHSFHNFFVGMILNNALSYLAPGMISVFQYAKKFSDGLAGVAIGPQANIYHARQAKAWVERDKKLFYVNVKVYLKNTLPIYIVGVFLVYFIMPWFLEILSEGRDAGSVIGIKFVFLALAAWQGIISIETIFAGVVVIAKRSMILWMVNGLFIISFFIAVKFIPNDSSVWWLAIAGLLTQCLNFIFYAAFAWRLTNKHFSQR